MNMPGRLPVHRGVGQPAQRVTAPLLIDEPARQPAER